MALCTFCVNNPPFDRQESIFGRQTDILLDVRFLELGLEFLASAQKV
jgi:hypothetical protein